MMDQNVHVSSLESDFTRLLKPIKDLESITCLLDKGLNMPYCVILQVELRDGESRTIGSLVLCNVKEFNVLQSSPFIILKRWMEILNGKGIAGQLSHTHPLKTIIPELIGTHYKTLFTLSGNVTNESDLNSLIPFISDFRNVKNRVKKTLVDSRLEFLETKLHDLYSQIEHLKVLLYLFNNSK